VWLDVTYLSLPGPERSLTYRRLIYPALSTAVPPYRPTIYRRCLYRRTAVPPFYLPPQYPRHYPASRP
jgi:hypothetical protein